jgi:excisionase family DNA binding protein
VLASPHTAASKVWRVTERLLTLSEAAGLVGCSVRTLRRRIERGSLPVFRDGRIVRVRELDLAGYIGRRTTCPLVRRAAPRRARLCPEPQKARWLFDSPDPLS